MIYDYKRGIYEDLTLQPLSLQADGSYQFLIVDGEVYKNGFTNLVLYTDAAGANPIPLGVGGGNYEYAEPDQLWTAQEALTGGTGDSVYTQFRVTNATYQGVDLWADFRNFGTYTSNSADYDIVGGSETINSTTTLTVPNGRTRYRYNFDSSLGDIAPTIGDGAFDGQQIILKDTGEANMTRIKGPGFYLGADSGGMYLKSRSILCTWNADDSVWEMDDSVTAEWVSGSQNVVQRANGYMRIYSLSGGTFSAQAFITVVQPNPVQFANSSYETSIQVLTQAPGGVAVQTLSIIKATNQISVSLITTNGSNISATINFDNIRIGKY